MADEPKIQLKEAPIKFWKTIFYHPNFGVVVGVIGVITGIFGVYAYYASIREPNLTYYISPTRTPIVQQGNLDNLSVTYWKVPITNDLSTAVIQIWNQGKAPIRNEDIRKPITIRMANQEAIYKYTIKTSRDVIKVNTVDSTEDSVSALFGELSFNWNMLEQGEGINIQIVYGGNTSVPITIDGVITGQKTLTQYNPANTEHPIVLFNLGLSNLLIGITVLLIFKLYLKPLLLSPYRFSWFFKLMFIALFTVNFCMGILLICICIYHIPVKPPFGF